MIGITPFVILVLAVNTPRVVGLNKYANRTVNTLTAMLRNYDRKIRPDPDGGPVLVKISIAILSFNWISEKKMEYSFSCYFRQIWKDPRLRFHPPKENATVLPLNAQRVLGEIWKPDTYIRNGKHSYIHEITTPNILLRMKSDGHILLSQRFTINARCPMYLKKFPLDTQFCPLEIGSLGYSRRDVVYHWVRTKKGCIEEPKSTSLSQFNLAGISCVERNVTAHTTYRSSDDDSAIIRAELKLVRQQGYFLLQLYIPCSMIVVLSWVSFWLNQEAAIARCSLGVTTVLTLTTLRLGAHEDLPEVSYPTALDVFLLVSFGFVIAALLEYIVIHVVAKGKLDLQEGPISRSGLRRKRGVIVVKNRKEPSYESFECTTPSSPSGTPLFYGHDTLPKRRRSDALQKQVNRLQRVLYQASRVSEIELMSESEKAVPVEVIDHYSKLFFPLSFFLFHALYWSIYILVVPDERHKNRNQPLV